MGRRKRREEKVDRNSSWEPTAELEDKLHHLARRWSRDRPEYRDDLYQEGLLAIWLKGETEAPRSHQLNTAQKRMLSVRKLGKSVDGKLDYLPFGTERVNEKTGVFETRYTFTDQENDAESSLLYYGARYYDTTLGRFSQTDPVVLDTNRQEITTALRNPQSLNPYSYTANNPLKYIDPDGESSRIPYAETLLDVAFTAEDVWNALLGSGQFIAGQLAGSDVYSNSGIKRATSAAIDLEIDIVSILLPISAPRKSDEIIDFAKRDLNAGTVKPYGNKADVDFIVSRSGVVVDKKTADRWHQGTFGNVVDSIEYHVGKHGKGRTIEQYTNDAIGFYQQNKQFGQSVILKDGSPGVRLQQGRVGGYFTTSGKVVTFWD